MSLIRGYILEKSIIIESNSFTSSERQLIQKMENLAKSRVRNFRKMRNSVTRDTRNKFYNDLIYWYNDDAGSTHAIFQSQV